MAVVDMPLEQLQKYTGISPRPDDFDQYWERALNEMRSTDPEISITKADFQAPTVDCYDLYFTGVKGARIYAKPLKTKNIPQKVPAGLEFHGYTGDCGDWVTKLHLASNGFIVASLDCRGQGGKSEDLGGIKGNTYKGHIIRGLDDHPDKLLYRDIFLDTAQLAQIVMNMDEVDETRLAATGVSQGGALTIACAALEPKIKLATPLYPFFSDYKRVWQMDLGAEAYIELKDYFRKFDPNHKRENEVFNKLGYIDIQNLAPRIKAKLVMFTGLRDDVCPPSSQFAAFNKMTCPKDMIIYPDFSHEWLPGASDKIFELISQI